MSDMLESLLDGVLDDIHAYIGNPCVLHIKVYDVNGVMGKLSLSLPFFLWKVQDLMLLFDGIINKMNIEVVRVEYDDIQLRVDIFN